MNLITSLPKVKRPVAFAVVLLSTWWSAAVHVNRVPGDDLSDSVQALIEQHRGDVAVAVRHLDSDESYEWRAEDVFPTASLIKLAVMVTAYRQADAGRLRLDDPVILTEADKVPGSGILTEHFSPGTTISLRDAIRLMIVWSDNTATNLVLDRIGLEATAEAMGSLGFPETRLHSKVYRRETSVFPERSARYGLGSTTARETVELLAALHRSEVATAAACAEMRSHLEHCEDRGKLAGDLPRNIRFAHKTGAIANTRCDAGILETPRGPVAICVLTTNNTDQSWSDDNEAQVLCSRIGRIVFDHFSPADAAANAEPDPGHLQPGSTGELVEMLQRTLNHRMTPSPELAVDGDFGPATAAVVRQFQESAGVPVTGAADPATLTALGPLRDAEPVPEPETINSASLPVRPADSLDGVPFVTCRAWLAVDAETGDTIGGQDTQRPLDIASTTKIMTAWLVLKLAQSDPSVLDEILTMSRRADDTPGSTSGIRAGEQLTVREALYGLLLPSGNDMSVALAEQFGHRLTEPGTEEGDPLELFVAAMNRESERLGMTSTSWKNPHGLTASRHRSTCHDLAILARSALSDSRFRDYVNTRRHATTVTGIGGYLRNVLWTNTNELLEIDGYNGVKTGTTSAARACLISASERNGRRIVLVVLGSAASESRYADSRNLYRWAWNEMASRAKP